MEVKFELEPGRVVISAEILNDIEVSSDERGFKKRAGFKIINFQVDVLIKNDWIDITKALSATQREKYVHAFEVYVCTKGLLDDLAKEMDDLFQEKRIK